MEKIWKSREKQIETVLGECVEDPGVAGGVHGA
jgi:hypothetical protein